MFCAPMPTRLPASASATPGMAIAGGQTTASAPSMASSASRISRTKLTASSGVLYIFQLPAMIGLRIVVPPLGCSLQPGPFFLLGEPDSSRLPDDSHLDLAGILHAVFNCLGDVLGKADGAQVVDGVRLHQDADLPAGLQRVGILHAFKCPRNVFQRADALDVVLQALAPGAGPRAGDGVGCLHDDRLNRLLIYFVVVRGDGVDYLLGHVKAPGELGAEH